MLLSEFIEKINAIIEELGTQYLSNMAKYERKLKDHFDNKLVLAINKNFRRKQSLLSACGIGYSGKDGYRIWSVNKSSKLNLGEEDLSIN